MFPTTHGSAVQGVRSDDPAERERSWQVLVAGYWKPAYKHLRVKWKLDPAAAEDTVQSFFAQAVEREFFAGFDPAKARFRTFFKLCLDRHRSNEHKRAARAVALDFHEAESELERAGPAVDPDEVFDRELKRHLFATAVSRLRQSCDPEVFQVFEQYDLCEPPRPRYEDLAQEHGVKVTDVTNWLAKARREVRALVQAQLRELEEEL